RPAHVLTLASIDETTKDRRSERQHRMTDLFEYDRSLTSITSQRHIQLGRILRCRIGRSTLTDARNSLRSGAPVDGNAFFSYDSQGVEHLSNSAERGHLKLCVSCTPRP